MKVLPIIVIFKFETGSALETHVGFEDEAARHAVAWAFFLGLNRLLKKSGSEDVVPAAKI